MTRGMPAVGGLGTLHTLRSPSLFWIASISDFCFEDEACHVSIAIGAGDREVFSVCRMVNCGCNAAKRIEPFRYPMAYVLQSEDGARAVMGSNIVLAETCSLVEGSKRITSPFSLPWIC